ncbi:putative porin [Cellulophaga tyrosinoxydans]|uniref:Putative porin n=1 Tax=Cellulophaga tyrosinoxydans TaxID=504486 RepID=A0A1W1ZET8_9FLAO|nr:putative porin [Cellulophaga tyrosinoxydans]SMC46913.1 Putative porin [Cellulophaga tyrosinoxydans]
MRYLFFIIFIFSIKIISAQETGLTTVKSDTLLSEKKDFKQIAKKEKSDKEENITIKDYKIISFSRDTTYLDTTLTIQKEYRYNYLRKDNFELLPLANMGQAYNNLGYDFESQLFYPKIGASAKHFNYLEMEDVKYYNVPTPTTDAMFKTVFEEGQFLDILLTFNLSKRLNYSIAYKGFRSLGKYNSSESEAGNFRTTANYQSKNSRYDIRMHIAAQDLINEENGGLSNKEGQFESGDADFSDRSRIDVNFTDAQTKILGKRYFFENRYKLIRKVKDSTIAEKTSLGIGHVFNYETKYYQFTQNNQNDYFGEAFVASNLSDKAILKTFYNQFSAEFYNSTLGRLKGNLNIYNYNYYFNSTLIVNNESIARQIKGEEISLGANYQKQIGGFNLKGDFAYNLSGKLTGTILNVGASYKIADDIVFSAQLHSSSKMPNFNFLLYQSDYANYNWDNTNTFNKTSTNSLNFNLDTKQFGNASVKITSLDNYSYFAVDPDQIITEGESESQFIKPYQETKAVNYLKVKYQKEFKYKGFALDNTIMYQTVAQSTNVLNVPQFTTRNSFYYSTDVFKKAMFLQTGVTFKYFTSYNMNSYNPLLGEFYIQNTEKLGGFPLLDFFINAKVQQTRIYLKAEHFNSSFSGFNYYSAPDYPYRDFIVRFGVVWNFFS